MSEFNPVFEAGRGAVRVKFTLLELCHYAGLTAYATLNRNDQTGRDAYYKAYAKTLKNLAPNSPYLEGMAAYLE